MSQCTYWHVTVYLLACHKLPHFQNINIYFKQNKFYVETRKKKQAHPYFFLVMVVVVGGLSFGAESFVV
jgi:hypothetical protein